MRLFVNGVEIRIEIDGELRGVNRKLDHIITHMRADTAREIREMTLVQDIQEKTVALQASVEAESTVNASVVTLLEGQSTMIAALKQQLIDAIGADGDPAALQAIVDALTALEAANTAQAAALAAAVVANTPASTDPAARRG